MATATYSVQTGKTDLKEYRRKVQAGIFEAMQFGVEEVELCQRLKKFSVDFSQREVTAELRLLKPTGVAAIPEGGKEARPSIPTAVTATVTWIFLNKRATMSRTTEIIARAQGSRANLINEYKWYGKNFTDALRAKLGDMFYGFSTGTVAKVSSISGDNIVAKDLYGIAGLGGTTHNRQVVDLFVEAASDPNRDYVAFLNPTGPALRTGGIQAVTAKTRSTNTLGVGASGVTGLAVDDLIVFANNLENTTLASGTERNENLIGLLDAATSTSVHSVSGSTYERWNASLADTTGGRFTGIKLMKGKAAIENYGGGKLNTVIWANGVKWDVTSQLMAGLRFGDAYGMELDGEPRSKGVEFFTSRRVPDTYVFGIDKTDSIHKWQIIPEPGQPGEDDLYKLQDDSGSLLSVDYPFALITTNRANIVYWSALTQS